MSSLSCGMQDLYCLIRDLSLWYRLSSWGVRVQLLCWVWDPGSLTRHRTRVPCIARQILNSWATKEVSVILIFNSWGKRDNIWGLLVVESEFDHNVKLLLGSVNVYPPNHTFGCFLRLCMHHAKSFQPCLTLFDTINCSSPGSSVCKILQTRILEWVAISYSRGSSQPGDQTHNSFSCIGRRVLYTSALWE